MLTCPAMGYPRPRIVWVKDGVVVQNKTTHTLLKWTVNVTKGSSSKYECYATNIHGKDYYPITVTIAGMDIFVDFPIILKSFAVCLWCFVVARSPLLRALHRLDSSPQVRLVFTVTG